MTTEELFDKYKEHMSLSEGQHDYLIDEEDFKEALLEFAKYHVELALQSANRNAKIEHSGWDSGQYHHHEIIEDSILNSYPLENIK